MQPASNFTRWLLSNRLRETTEEVFDIIAVSIRNVCMLVLNEYVLAVLIRCVLTFR